VDFDLRGSLDEVSARAEAQLSAKPVGRPHLGVSSREVTLLPRHWLWLEGQRGGASAALRRLVEEAIRSGAHMPPATDAVYRQMSALAGNFPHFEEAARMLYAGKFDRLEEAMALWPAGIRDYLLMRVAVEFNAEHRDRSSTP
jgi:hypothetical protein